MPVRPHNYPKLRNKFLRATLSPLLLAALGAALLLAYPKAAHAGETPFGSRSAAPIVQT